MKPYRAIAFCVAVALLAAGGFAQEFWVKKPWKEWNPNETKKMLEDSPWARKWVFSVVESGTQVGGYSGTGRESRQELWYTVQLRSAAPLRQGVARDVQLQNKYDKMGAEQKAAMDQQTDRFLSGAGGDTIVVHVVFGSTMQDLEREAAKYWKDFQQETALHQVNLTTSSGKRLNAVRYVPPPGGAYEFEFIFPRAVDGAPVVTDKDKSIRVEFPAGLIRSRDRVFVEYKLDKMKWNGELAY